MSICVTCSSDILCICITTMTCEGLNSLFCTCGSLCYFRCMSMTESVNYCLCNENFITYGAMLTFCKTCCCTCRCFSYVNYFCMTESVNYCLSNENLVTSATVLTFCKTCCCTCRSYRLINYYLMAKSCLEYFSTVLADTGLSACCACLIMSCCGNFAIVVGMSAILTCMCCIAGFCTCGCCNNGSIVMFLHRNNICFLVFTSFASTSIFNSTRCGTC